MMYEKLVNRLRKAAGPAIDFPDTLYDEAADAIEELSNKGRPTGRWIIRDNPGTGWYRITCSECGEDVTATAPCIGFFPNAKVNWDYCPYCGSKLEVEQNA